MYLDRTLERVGPHWTANHLLAPDTRMTVDPQDVATLDGHSPQLPQMWNTAVRTMRMAPGGQRLMWPGVEDLLTVSRAA